MIYTAPNLPIQKHIFFNRFGGVSSGKYESMNVSFKSQDDKQNILKNLNLAAGHFNKTIDDLNILIQGVSNKAVYIERPSQFKITADGAVTDKPNIILSVRTADCAPILFYDEKHQIIGIAHAGWRGALRGIIENTLDLMLSLGAKKETIAAAIGPCLQKKSFECQKDMFQEFMGTNPSYEKFFEFKDDNHWLFDAQNFCIHRLNLYGIENISASNIDTYTDSEYFSYRRYSHNNLVNVPLDFPTHLSTIML